MERIEEHTKTVSNGKITVTTGQWVILDVVSEDNIGWRTVVNGRHYGVLYKNQTFRPVHIGDRLDGFVHKIVDCSPRTPRIDVILQKPGRDGLVDAAKNLLMILTENGGTLPIGDNSNHEYIVAITGMSKRIFKKALGILIGCGVAGINLPDRNRIFLTGNASDYQAF